MPNIYPWSPARYRREMRNPDFGEFRLIADEAGLLAGEEEAAAAKRAPDDPALAA